MRKGNHSMNHERYKYPELEERYQRRLETIQKMTEQELLAASTTELLKLKRLLRFGRQSERFQGYPKTSLMNQYRRVLVSRKVTIPPITLSTLENDSKDSSVEGAL